MNLTTAKLMTSGLLLLAMGTGIARAESINPPTMPQTAPMTAAEKKNLAVVLNFWREVLASRHVDLADKYLAAGYIQHNPTVSTGRDGFVKAFAARPPVPIPAKLETLPVVSGARGDYVWLIWEREQKDPRNAANTYHYNTFDVFRMDKGLVQEHWDSAKRNDKSPVVEHGLSPKPPMEWHTGKLSAEEKQTLALATEELKDMLQYGHLELAGVSMARDYIQHNPNVPQGRDGFIKYMSAIPGRRPNEKQEIKPEWKSAPVLTLVNGPYSFMMFDRTSKDPSNPAKDYVWSHFDVVRAEKGVIMEHWDEAIIAPPVPPT